MQWEVTGASRETGEEIAYIIEADNEASATRRGNRAGLMVSAVRQLDPDDSLLNAPPIEAIEEPQPPLENFQASDPLQELSGMLPAIQPRQHSRPMGPPCPFCGSHRMAVRRQKGSFALAVFLIFCAILPGIIYAIWGCGYQFVCPNCGGVRGQST